METMITTCISNRITITDNMHMNVVFTEMVLFGYMFNIHCIFYCNIYIFLFVHNSLTHDTSKFMHKKYASKTYSAIF